MTEKTIYLQRTESCLQTSPTTGPDTSATNNKKTTGLSTEFFESLLRSTIETSNLVIIMSNIRELPPVQNPLAGATDKMNRDMPTLTGAFAAIAQARKAYYDAHVEAGFTPEQAMDMVRQFNDQTALPR